MGCAGRIVLLETEDSVGDATRGISNTRVGTGIAIRPDGGRADGGLSSSVTLRGRTEASDELGLDSGDDVPELDHEGDRGRAG